MKKRGCPQRGKAVIDLLSPLPHSAGRDIQDIQAWLGHSDITTTLNVYGHVLNGNMDKLGQVMDQMLFQGSLQDVFYSCNFLQVKQKKKSKNLEISQLFLADSKEFESSASRMRKDFVNFFGLFLLLLAVSAGFNFICKPL